MKKLLARLFAVLLVAVIGLTGCSGGTSGKLTGDYQQDTLALIDSLRTAIELPNDSPDKLAAQSEAKKFINDFASRYRRDDSVAGLTSFTTMRTALNAIAGHYTSYPNRPISDKLHERIEKEFARVEAALRRGA
ncbi:photosystem II protein Psb27 [filamentous cyanobacterium CCP5]|nr:photosystem II protein Psb27 [filamentous cyanobacterium CCP5]